MLQNILKLQCNDKGLLETEVSILDDSACAATEPSDISTTSLNDSLNTSREALSLASPGMLTRTINSG